MSKRLEILKNSLRKKEELRDSKINEHFETWRETNGQPMNDKRNGKSFFNKTEKQNDSIRRLNESIEKTKLAIEKEEQKISNVANFEVPDCIKELIENGTLTQWRKHPRFFFVTGVEKARIVLNENGCIAARYISEIKTQDDYAKFRDVFNGLAKKIRGEE